MRRFFAWGLFVHALFWPGLATATDTEPFRTTPCPFNERQFWGATPKEIECGVLSVPARHGQGDGEANGARYELPVVILRSPAAEKLEPVVEAGTLEGIGMGGPRGDHPFRTQRDFFMLALRGARQAHPHVSCPQQAHEFVRAELGAPTREAAVESQTAAMQACLDTFVTQQIDAGSFSTHEAALDLRDLRLALGIPRWNVVGMSYGSRLAQVAAALDPEGVQALILDAPAPLDLPPHGTWQPALREALGRLAIACADDDPCQGLGPNVHKTYDRHASGTGPTARSVRVVTQAALYGPAAATVPLFLAELDQGNDTPLEFMTAGWMERMGSFPFGLWWLLQGNDYAGSENLRAWKTASTGQNPGPALLEAEASVIDRWPFAGRQLPEPPRDVPTLVLTGEFDPITPVSHGEHIASGNPQAFTVAFPNVGHGVLKYRCPVEIAGAFLTDPTKAPDTRCVADMRRTLDMATQSAGFGPAPGFITDVHVVPWLGRLGLALRSGLNARTALLLLAAIVLLSVVVWPLAWLARKALRRPARPSGLRLERVVAAMATASVILFVVACGIAVRGTPREALPFGVAPSWGWATYLWTAPVVLGFELGRRVLLVYRRRDGSRTARFHLALVAIATVLFACIIRLG